MIHVRLYFDADHPGEKLLVLLEGLRTEIEFKVNRVDISENPDLTKLYQNKVPFLEIGPYKVQEPVDVQRLKATLMAQADRLELVDEKKQLTFDIADRISYWMSKNFVLIVMLFLFFYSGLPVLAPVFMKLGLEGLARPIYSIYSPLCHQFAHRSFFLFGEQIVYPAEAAGLEDLISFEEASGYEVITQRNAKEFLGNEELGYKMALCERDIAMYGSMLLFGVIFLATGRRIKPPHLAVWVVLGIGPIALDGGTQLLSQLIDLPFLPYRESIPLLRVLTGTIFGFVTGWLGFPLLEEGMEETRQAFAVKQAKARETEE